MRAIGLLGATGFTGRLTAAEFAARGIDVRLGARSRSRLAKVDATDASERVTVDATNSRDLAGFMAGLDVVISTIGPFTSLGRPVVDAAVAAGVHYIDSTGEPGFMAELYDEFRGATSAVVPACGFDYLPGDCAAFVAVSMLDAGVDSVRVGYVLNDMRPTRGTAMSALEAALATPSPRLRRTEIEGRTAIGLPWGEELMVPRWAPGAAVDCAITAPRVISAIAPFAGPLTGPMLRLGAPVLRRLVMRMPEGPSDDARQRATCRVVVTASGAGQSVTTSVDVSDVYGFTALALVECAFRVEGGGAMSPAQAFDAGDLLDALRGPMLWWTRPTS
ncbi:MAG TPA: NAD(P)H-binding protein [Mycobacteriales bacterium]|nr:NAD(P)H-binding protein [Mycobacteriales bacterium]